MIEPSDVEHCAFLVAPTSEKKVVEIYSCIVCARTLNFLAVYTPVVRLVDCAVTSFSGQRVPNKRQLLVTCDTHTAGEIEAAYQKWQSRNGTELDDELEDKKTVPHGL
jgi:hypothetical protein